MHRDDYVSGRFGRPDPPVVRLCQAINALPGVWTINSCCGHSRQPFIIFCRFDTSDPRGLTLLTRAVDRRYWRYGHKWSLALTISDIYNPKYGPASSIILELASRGQSGPATYRQADDLARNIEEHLKDEAFLWAFGLESLHGITVPYDPDWNPRTQPPPEE